MIIVYIVMLLVLILAGVVLFALFYRVRGKCFDSNGVSIHFTDEGAGVPIILVHGFAVQSDLQWRWPGCVRKLRQGGYRVIMMDVRGHGLSGKPYNPEAYGEELSDDIVRLMDHLGIKKAHLAGYSMGGFITLKTIARHPNRLLSGVICAAGWGELDETHTALLKEIVSGIEERREFDAITNWVDAKRHAPKLACALANFFMRSMNDLRAIVNVFRKFDALAVDGEILRNNNVPALTLVGTRDGIREVSDRLPGVMANHEIEYIPGGDHLSTVLKPQFMRGMLAFLDAHSQA